jgi:hypothetical protein
MRTRTARERHYPALAGTEKRAAEPMRVEPTRELLPTMPEETARALRRLLAEMLVRDYLVDSKGKSRGHGDSSPGDVIPPGGLVAKDAEAKR